MTRFELATSTLPALPLPCPFSATHAEVVKVVVFGASGMMGSAFCRFAVRRGFATELRRKGLGELDIAELGRWSSVVMVKRYSRAYTFDDAAKRYKPIVT